MRKSWIITLGGLLAAVGCDDPRPTLAYEFCSYVDRCMPTLDRIECPLTTTASCEGDPAKELAACGRAMQLGLCGPADAPSLPDACVATCADDWLDEALRQQRVAEEADAVPDRAASEDCAVYRVPSEEEVALTFCDGPDGCRVLVDAPCTETTLFTLRGRQGTAGEGLQITATLPNATEPLPAPSLMLPGAATTWVWFGPPGCTNCFQLDAYYFQGAWTGQLDRRAHDAWKATTTP